MGADGPTDLPRDMEDPSLNGLIERSAILANAFGVRRTPAYVIGDGMIGEVLPLKPFLKAIVKVRVAPEGARNQGDSD